MPYITKKRREELDSFLIQVPMVTSGELNYKVTKLILEYLTTNGIRYQTFNDIIGALESAKAEFQRRVIAPYEDKKIIENGDVYDGNS